MVEALAEQLALSQARQSRSLLATLTSSGGWVRPALGTTTLGGKLPEAARQQRDRLPVAEETP